MSERAWDRLGLIVKPDDIERQIDSIKSGDATLHAIGYGGRQLWSMPCKHRAEVYAVYCPALDAIVTYLPERSWFLMPGGERLDAVAA